MSGWFEINKTTNGQYHFVLKAANGQVILQSETYVAKDSATTGIQSVRANCGNDRNYQRQDSANGKYYFNLKAANSQVIGTSQVYSSAAARDQGIQSVMANGQSMVVVDNTRPKPSH